MDPQSPITVTYRGSDEPLHTSRGPAGATVGDFWAWSGSDLIANTTRGLLAEYIVGLALGAVQKPRQEWAPWDLTTPKGVTVEVKSAAYVQGWEQKRPSAIRFSVAKTVAWDAEAGYAGSQPRRQADVYVFALLAELDRSRLDPLNLHQWEFYVIATAELDAKFPEVKTVSLGAVRRLSELTTFDGLYASVSVIASSSARASEETSG